MLSINDSWLSEYKEGLMNSKDDDAREAAEDIQVISDWYEMVIEESRQQKVGVLLLRGMVKAYLYTVATTNDCGTACLDAKLLAIKRFSHWCFVTERLSYDFALALEYYGKTTDAMHAYIRSEWGVHDRFYGVPQ